MPFHVLSLSLSLNVNATRYAIVRFATEESMNCLNLDKYIAEIPEVWKTHIDLFARCSTKLQRAQGKISQL